MKKKRWLWVLVAVVGIAVVTPSYVRAYRVGGPSDAPSFLLNDRIIVNKAAYDIRLPYTNIVILSHSRPESGDVVMYRPPQEDYTVFKRVIGGPGDTVAMRDNRVEINGVALQYEPVDAADYLSVAEENKLGAVIETEAGHGPPHLTTHTPGACSHASFDPVQVPDDHYFVMGDNRDNSKDSRMYGSIPRASIVGKVVRPYGSFPRAPGGD
jgi:signal peptidase I